MWTDLFKPAASRSFKTGVDRVDGLSVPVSLPAPAETLVRPGVVAESVDRVDLHKAYPVDTFLLVIVAPVSDALPGVDSPCVAMPTASASTESTSSTQSTQSTPEKHCRLLTVAEKNALLAQFELAMVRAEIEASVAGRYTADDLRRTINVAWRLISVERLDFDTAMAKAAEWVAAQPMHQDELFFADVLTFSKGA